MVISSRRSQDDGGASWPVAVVAAGAFLDPGRDGAGGLAAHIQTRLTSVSVEGQAARCGAVLGVLVQGLDVGAVVAAPVLGSTLGA